MCCYVKNLQLLLCNCSCKLVFSPVSLSFCIVSSLVLNSVRFLKSFPCSPSLSCLVSFLLISLSCFCSLFLSVLLCLCWYPPEELQPCLLYLGKFLFVERKRQGEKTLPLLTHSTVPTMAKAKARAGSWELIAGLPCGWQECIALSPELSLGASQGLHWQGAGIGTLQQEPRAGTPWREVGIITSRGNSCCLGASHLVLLFIFMCLFERQS